MSTCQWQATGQKAPVNPQIEIISDTSGGDFLFFGISWKSWPEQQGDSSQPRQKEGAGKILYVTGVTATD